jgi:hypothetical protein
MHEYTRYEMQYAIIMRNVICEEKRIRIHSQNSQPATVRTDRRYSDSYYRLFPPFLSFFLSFCLLPSEREKGKKDGKMEK